MFKNKQLLASYKKKLNEFNFLQTQRLVFQIKDATIAIVRIERETSIHETRIESEI